MKMLLSTLIILFSTCLAFSQQLDIKYHKAVSDFITSVKSNQSQTIANKIKFPLKREYPLPSIKDRNDFIKRYKELFDDQLLILITKSDVKTDWSAMGWRGIMLPNGSVWLDYDGKLIAINYQTNAEKLKRIKLINADKLILYISLRQFKNPILQMRTNKFKVRIDELANGSYRYASWPLKEVMSSKPSLIIHNGKYIPEGSGGNYSFKFLSGNYRYECNINAIGEEDAPDAGLTIYKDGKEILSQSASMLK
ncbi:MAG: hypothetical protein EOO92_08945 [Pedobacter sp.]|nr:MAG: hypothetical protein EOO92_08945 [Pedobacter sp.]